MSAVAGMVASNEREDTMDIDWHQLIWDGRWAALEFFWTAVVVNVAAHWWFGPLMVIIVISAGRKKIVRFGAYVARVFGHAEGGA